MTRFSCALALVLALTFVASSDGFRMKRKKMVQIEQVDSGDLHLVQEDVDDEEQDEQDSSLVDEESEVGDEEEEVDNEEQDEQESSLVDEESEVGDEEDQAVDESALVEEEEDEDEVDTDHEEDDTATETEEEDEEAIQRELHPNDDVEMSAESVEPATETEEEDEEAIQHELHADDEESMNEVTETEEEDEEAIQRELHPNDDGGAFVEEEWRPKAGKISTAGPKEVALKYIEARKGNDPAGIRALLTEDASFTKPFTIPSRVPEVTYTGWEQIQTYLKDVPYFWTYPEDVLLRGDEVVEAMSGNFIALIDFEVYKFFVTWKLRETVKISPDNKIFDITLKKI